MFGDWNIGDLLIVTDEHTICKSSLNTFGSDWILKNTDGTYAATAALQKSTIVMALDPRPNPGELARVRIVHNESIWVANSNYLKPCTRG